VLPIITHASRALVRAKIARVGAISPI